MVQIILYEDEQWSRFLPLVYLRGLFELRCGAGELWQRVERLAEESQPQTQVDFWCRPELADLIGERTGRPVNQPTTDGCLLLNGRGFWFDLPAVEAGESSWVGTLGEGGAVACIRADATLAAKLTPAALLDADQLQSAVAGLPQRDVSGLVRLFDWPWEVVHFNASAVGEDFRQAMGPQSLTQFPGVHLLNPAGIHIGAGSRIKPCTVIDAEEGPVWIGARVTVQPHAYIQGPCYIGNDCLIQPGAVVREGCSFGPRCKVGGEVEASIVQSFSNKQHDGFLGHAYLGQWINIGADCLNSDLKNTYGTVRVPVNGREVETNEQFVGLLMGDYAKTGINVAFPTGAVVGVCSNVVVPAAPKFTPSFSWIDPRGVRAFDVERGLEAARRMMSRRQQELTPALEAALRGAQQRATEIEVPQDG